MSTWKTCWPWTLATTPRPLPLTYPWCHWAPLFLLGPGGVIWLTIPTAGLPSRYSTGYLRAFELDSTAPIWPHPSSRNMKSSQSKQVSCFWVYRQGDATEAVALLPCLLLLSGVGHWSPVMFIVIPMKGGNKWRLIVDLSSIHGDIVIFAS